MAWIGGGGKYFMPVFQSLIVLFDMMNNMNHGEESSPDATARQEERYI